MNILLAKPFGYCYGVSKAMEIALKAKEEHPASEVYLIGAPVHNEDAISALLSKGLRLLDGDFDSLLRRMEGLEKGSIVVFSAHGHPSSFDEAAKRKGFQIYDGTCAFVKENLGTALLSHHPIIYVGQEKHAEKEAFLASCPKAFYFNSKDGEGDWRKCPASPEIVCQTTLSGDEVEKAFAEIKAAFPEARLAKERCTATRVRQEKVAELSKKADAAIVLGSSTSNNASKLYEIAKSNCPAWLCLDEKEVAKLDLSPYGTLLVCSSASTSKEIVERTLAYLSSL